MATPNEPDSSALIPPKRTPESVLASMRLLTQSANEDVPKMPERMFVEHILPMLSAPAGTAVDLTRWLEVAGTPLRALDIVDDAGQTLFRVPALMRTLPTAFQEEISYSNIVHEAQLRENVHPAQAEVYLDNQLRKTHTGATFLDVETAMQWNTIRKRYGLPLLTIVGPDGQITTESTSVGGGSGGSLVVSDDDDSFL